MISPQKSQNTRRGIRLILIAAAALWSVHPADAVITFTQGHIYSTNTHSSIYGDEARRNVIEYSATGTVLGSLTIPWLIEGEEELRGIAFGPDGFLYAVITYPHGDGFGFAVLVLNSFGTVLRTYTYGAGYSLWASDGKIAVDQQYIYVAGGDDLIRFTVGDSTSGVSIYTNTSSVFDVKILPSGNLFVANGYGIDEITDTGTLVRSISLTGGQYFVDVRGIEYNPATNKLFVTQLGYSGYLNFEFKLMRINASTGLLENSVTFVYANDLFLTQSGTLLVGADAEDPPRIYNQNLVNVGTIGTAQRLFVTQYLPFSPRDFNRDGKPDYLLYNAATRQTAVWYLDNNAYIGGAYGLTLPVGWRIIDVADFNRDGKPDYALFNASTRQTAIWYLSGVMFIGSAWGPTLPAGWALMATGDFNNDAKPDYLLYNANTHQTAAWFLNNNVYVGGAYGPTIPAPWSLVGVADFNRDGKSDYLLFNPSTHYSLIWYLSGTTRIGSTFGPTIAAGYNLMGATDFDGNSKPDYLLYNPSTRATALWYMNNNVRTGSAVGPPVPAGWTLAVP
jgi:hypothetical protein